MSPRPRLSLCIPTWNRGRFLKDALESGLREAASQPPGAVEVIVCDNASSDETQAVIASIHAAHPELRAFRNDENIGFDRNYLRCVEEARGVFVWVMGDDDLWLPGSVARVLYELEAGADACLCLAEVCDIGLNPQCVLTWYRNPNPPRVWCLETPEDLVRYFDTCRYNAAVFAFISVGIFRRERFLQNRDDQQRDLDSGYIHVWSMMKSFRRPLKLHYIPEALVQNRLTDAVCADTNIFNRLMQDFSRLGAVADAVFGDDPAVHDSFSRIIGRNHDDGFNVLPWIRLTVPSQAAWSYSVPYLIRAGYSPARIAAVDFGIGMMYGPGFPTAILGNGARTFVDLSFLIERPTNIAVLALGGMPNVTEGGAILAALRKKEEGQIRVFCPRDCLEILDGFDVQSVDARQYARDGLYRDSIVKAMLDFAPALAVNLDPARGLEADDLMATVLPAGAIAYALPDRGQDADLRKAANAGYTCLIPNSAGPEAILETLGLAPTPATLWPTPVAREEALAILEKLGWDPAHTLVILVDHPTILDDSSFRSALAEAASGPWTLMGLGGKGVSYQSMETLLGPWADRSVNLTGALGFGSTAALLQLCGGYLGGTPLARSMAKACGCLPI